MAQQDKPQSRAADVPIGGVRRAWGVAPARSDSPSRASTAVGGRRGWRGTPAALARQSPTASASFSISAGSMNRVWWIAAGLATGCAYSGRLPRHVVAFVVTLAIFRRCFRFAIAALKDGAHRHTILRYPASGVRSPAFVELRDESPAYRPHRGARRQLDGNRIEGKPQRVRLSVKRGMAPPAGAYIRGQSAINRRCSRCAPTVMISPAIFFTSASALRLRQWCDQDRRTPATAGLLARRRRRHPRPSRRDRPTHTRRRTGDPARSLGADHGQA